MTYNKMFYEGNKGILMNLSKILILEFQRASQVRGHVDFTEPIGVIFLLFGHTLCPLKSVALVSQSVTKVLILPAIGFLSFFA